MSPVRPVNNMDAAVEIPNFWDQAGEGDLKPAGVPDQEPTGPEKPRPDFDRSNIDAIQKAREEASVLRIGSDSDLNPMNFGQFVGNRFRRMGSAKSMAHFGESLGEEFTAILDVPQAVPALGMIFGELDQLNEGTYDAELQEAAPEWARYIPGLEMSGGMPSGTGQPSFTRRIPWDEKDAYPILKAVGKFYRDRYGWGDDLFWARMDRTITEDPVGFMADIVTIATFLMPIKAGGAVASKTGKLLGRVPRHTAFANKLDRAFGIGRDVVSSRPIQATGRFGGRVIEAARRGPVPFAGKIANSIDSVKHPMVHGFASHFADSRWYDGLDPFLAIPNMGLGSARGLLEYAKVARTPLTPALETALNRDIGRRDIAIEALEGYIGEIRADRQSIASRLDESLREIKMSHNAAIKSILKEKSGDLPDDRIVNLNHFKRLLGQTDKQITESFAHVIYSSNNTTFRDMIDSVIRDESGFMSLPFGFLDDGVDSKTVDELISVIEQQLKNDPDNPIAPVMSDMLDALRKDQLDDVDFGSSTLVDYFNNENDVIKRYVRESILNGLTEQLGSYDIDSIADIDQYNKVVDDVVASDMGADEMDALYSALGGEGSPPVDRLQGVMMNRLVNVLQSGSDDAITEWLDKIDGGNLEKLLGSDAMEFFDQFDETLDAFSQIAQSFQGRASVDEIRSALDQSVQEQARNIDFEMASMYDDADNISVGDDEVADTADFPIDEEMSVDEINEMLRGAGDVDDDMASMLGSSRFPKFSHSYMSMGNPAVRQAVQSDAAARGVDLNKEGFADYKFLFGTRRDPEELGQTVVPSGTSFRGEPDAELGAYPQSTVGRDQQGRDVGLSRVSAYKSAPDADSPDLDKYNINFANRVFIFNIVRQVFRQHDIADRADSFMVDAIINQARFDFGAYEQMQDVFRNQELMEELRAGNMGSIMEADPVTLADIKNYAEIAAREIKEGRVPTALEPADNFDPLRNELDINRDAAEAGDISRNIDEGDTQGDIHFDSTKHEPEPHVFDEFPDDPSNRQVDEGAISDIRGIQPILRDRQWLFHKPEFEFDDPQSYGWYMSRINYFQRVLPDLVARGEITRQVAAETKSAYAEASRRLDNPVVFREEDIPEAVQAGKQIYEDTRRDDFFTGVEERLGGVEDLDILKEEGRHWLLQRPMTNPQRKRILGLGESQPRPENIEFDSPEAYDWYRSRSDYFEHVLPGQVNKGEISQDKADMIRRAYHQSSEALGQPSVFQRSDIPESVMAGEAEGLRRRGIRNAYGGFEQDLSDIEDIELITGDRAWLLQKPDVDLQSPEAYEWYRKRADYFEHVLPRQADESIVNRHRMAYTQAAARLGIPVALTREDIPESVKAGSAAYDQQRRAEGMRRGAARAEAMKNPETPLSSLGSDEISSLIASRGSRMTAVEQQDLIQGLDENATIQDLYDAIAESATRNADEAFEKLKAEHEGSFDDDSFQHAYDELFSAKKDDPSFDNESFQRAYDELFSERSGGSDASSGAKGSPRIERLGHRGAGTVKEQPDGRFRITYDAYDDAGAPVHLEEFITAENAAEAVDIVKRKGVSRSIAGPGQTTDGDSGVPDDAPPETEDAASAGEGVEGTVSGDLDGDLDPPPDVEPDPTPEPEQVPSEPPEDPNKVVREYVAEALKVDVNKLKRDSWLRDRFTDVGITALLRFLGGTRRAGISGAFSGAIGAMAGEVMTGLGVLALTWGAGRTWDKLKPFVQSAGTSSAAVKAFEIMANEAVSNGTLRGLRFGRLVEQATDEDEDGETQ